MSVTVTTIHNPFNETENHIEVLEYSPGMTLADCLPPIELHDGMVLVAAVNGRVVTEDYDLVEIADGDKIAVSAKTGVEMATAVAMWAASATAYVTSSIVVANIVGAIVWGATFLAVSFAVGYGINQLVNALGLGPKTPGGDGSGQSSPTYSWGPLVQTETEGFPIPIVFGEHRIAGQVINQFVTIEDDGKEYLHALLAINDGQVDAISDIRINDQPVASFKGVETYTRLGTLNDEPIPGFGEIVQQHNLQYRLAYSSAASYQTDGNAVEKIVVVLTAPGGMYYANDEGGLSERAVSVQIEYRQVGTATWTNFGFKLISGATTSAIRKSFTIDNLTAGQYEVRITRWTTDSTSFRESTTVLWTGLKEVVKESLIYPGLAKYAIKALATDQLSGSRPTFSCLVRRSTVSVYNPNTAAWVTHNAKNPAWAAYALLNTHHGIHYSRLLYDEFEDWASYCDELVDGVPRFQASVVLDTQANAWQNVQRIAQLARASIIRRGSKYGVFCDKPESVVSHLFSAGNILDGTFNMQYLPMTDRANAVEITYTDPDRDYTNQVVAVYSAEYATSGTQAKKANVQFLAAIPRAQVIREAAYQLNSNKYLVRAIEFEADIDSFACVVGDLAYFQHMTPEYADAWGGRIVAAGDDDGSGNPYVKLDQDVDLVAGTAYAILVRLGDDTLVERQLQAVVSNQTTDTLLLTTQWGASVPEEFDPFICGKATTYKKTYRITNISRAQELTRRITCVEYHDAIHSDTGYVIETPTWGDAVVQEAVRVKVSEYLTYGKDGSYLSSLAVSWHPATDTAGSNWVVWLEDITLRREFVDIDGTGFSDIDGTAFTNTGETPGLWKVGETSETAFVINSTHLVIGHEYRVYVGPAGGGAADTGDNTATVKVSGKLAPPNDVTVFAGTWNAMKRTVSFNWTAVDNIDLSHYEIRQGNTWDAGTVVQDEALGTSAAIQIDEGVSATRVYWIKAVDTSGIYSENALSTQVAINTAETPLQIPEGLVLSTESGIAADGTDRVTLLAVWGSNAEADPHFRHYELVLEVMATGKKSAFSTAEAQYQWEVLPNTEYGVAVRAVDMTFNRTSYCTQETITSAKDAGAPAAPAWAATPLVPGFKVIGLRWNSNSEYDLSYYEVERSTTGAFSGEQVSLGKKDGNFTTDTDLAVSTAYYYRVRAVDTSGNASAWSTVQNATTLQVGQADIAYNSIIADHINVNALSALSADIGAVTSGQLRSSNWGTAAGMLIDLDNETFQAGGSSNPFFYLDAIEARYRGSVTITGGSGAMNLSDGPAEAGATNDSGWRHASDTTQIDGGKIYAGSQIQIGNLDGVSDYCLIDSGNIDFYYYLNNEHHVYKSLNRVEYGVANSGATVQLPGYWRNTPRVIVSPKSLEIYKAAYSSQDQRILVDATNIAEIAPGIYSFVPVAILSTSESSSFVQVNSTVSREGSSNNDILNATLNTPTRTTVNNVTKISISASWSAVALFDEWGPPGCGEPGDAIIDLSVFAYIDGVSFKVADHYSIVLGSNRKSGTISRVFNVAAGAHTIYLSLVITKISNHFPTCFGWDEIGFGSLTFHSYEVEVGATSSISEGSLNWMAIGE